MNRRTPKIEKLLSKSTSQKSAPISLDRQPEKGSFAGTPAGCPRDTRPSMAHGTSETLCDVCLCAFCAPYESGKKKKPKPKLFGPDIFGWAGGLPREGVGAKKFGMSFETQGIKLFAGMSRDLAGISRQNPEKFEKKKFVFNFRSLMKSPEFAQPGLSRSNGSHSQREGTNLGVCLFLYGWSYSGLRLQMWACSICVFSICSNGALRIRVGLELVEKSLDRV